MRKWIYRVFGIYMVILLGLVLLVQVQLSNRALNEFQMEFIREQMGKEMDEVWLDNNPVKVTDEQAVDFISENILFYIYKDDKLLKPYTNKIMDVFITQREKEDSINLEIITEWMKKNEQNRRLEPNKSEYIKLTLPDNSDEELNNLSYVYKNKHNVEFVILLKDFRTMETVPLRIILILAIPVVVGMFISLIIIYFLSKGLNKSLSILTKQTQQMVDMDFKPIEIDISGTSEIVILRDALNTLAERLDKALRELKGTNGKLSEELIIKEKQQQAMQQLLSDISHELKTPITIINGHAQGLMDDVGDSYYYSSCIADEATRMELMVKELLDYVKWEWKNNDGLDHRKEEVDLVALVRHIKQRYTQMLEEKEQEILITSHEKAYVLGAPVPLTRMIKNLVANSIYHGEDKSNIHINIKQDQRGTLFSIDNTCEQIDEQELRKIWLPFYKLDKSRVRVESGSGLGLAMVKRIVENHSGEIGTVYRNGRLSITIWFPK